MILNIHYFLLKTTFKVENYHQSAIYIDLVKHESSWLAIQICTFTEAIVKIANSSLGLYEAFLLI